MTLDELASGKPFLIKEQVVKLVREKYNLDVRQMKSLDGYDNQNFLIESMPASKEDALNGEVAVTKYVLKITNSTLSKSYEVLRDSTYMMDFLFKRGFVCPQPVINTDGNLYDVVLFKNMTLNADTTNEKLANQKIEDSFMVRLLTYLPGKTLNDLEVVPSHIFEEMGETLGRMHNAFKDITIEPKVLQDWGNTYDWSMNTVMRLKEFLYVIEDPKRRQIAEEVIDAFESKVLKKKQDLPQGFLHGDYNDVNILVTKTSKDGEIHLSGIIDFDDVYHSPIVFDVGSAITYIMQCKTPSIDIAAACFLRGYQKYHQLNSMEISSIYYCVGARFTQTLINGLYSYSQNHDEYVLSTQTRGWDAFLYLWDAGKEEIYKKWGIY